MIRRAVLLLASAALLAACDGPTSPGATLALQVVDGNAQEGLPGTPLAKLLTVRAVRADGSPAAEVEVRFEAAPGAGTVQAGDARTNATGIAWAVWHLPNEPSAALSVAAQAEGAEPVTFTAGVLPRDRADLLLNGAPSLFQAIFHVPGTLTGPDVFTASGADSMLLPPPRLPESRHAVLAFTQGRPPLLREGLSWTAGRDTLRLEFPRPVTLPLTIWVIAAPYATVRASMEMQLAAAAHLWAGAGILLDDVRWVDATTHPEASRFQGVSPACGTMPVVIGKDAGRTNVYLPRGPLSIGSTQASGYGCAPDETSMWALILPNWPMLFAHELGHTLGLSHLGGQNVMDPSATVSALTLGQVFWAHAHSLSSMQVLHADRAVISGRNCSGFVTPASCLPPQFDL